MKNLIILGKPRSGKTTLAEQINKQYNMGIISTDCLRSAFFRFFPENGIGLGVPTSDEKLTPWLMDFVNIQSSRSLKYVIEGCECSPRMVFKHVDHEKFKIVCLGYPTLTLDELFEAVRANDTDMDWSKKRTDEELRNEIVHYIGGSKQWQKDCEELGILFIDTGTDRQLKKDEFVNNLEEFLK